MEFTAGSCRYICKMKQLERCSLVIIFLLVTMLVDVETRREEDLQDNFMNVTSNEAPGKALTKLIKRILKNYDRKIRPFYGVKPLHVDLDVLILSFGEIKEANMEYVVDIYLGQFWHDHRFALGLNQNYTMGDEFVHQIWTPDTFVINAIKTQIHRLTKENQKIFMNLTNGFTMHTSRLRLTASCKMEFRSYPKDTQVCSLPFESYTYEEFELTFAWRTNDSIIMYDKEMAQFTVASVVRQQKHPQYHSPQFSGLTVVFTFQRRWIYYIIQVYIPCICITVLSWIGFWIDHKAVPARTGLGITTVLTMVYMLASVNSNLPRVTYLKSIDYYVLVCFGFIFLTSIEYVLAIRYSRSRKEVKERLKQKRVIEETSDEETQPLTVQVNQGGKIVSFYEKPPSYECNGHASNTTSRPTLTRGESKSSSLLYNHVIKPRRQNSSRRSTSGRSGRASPLNRMVTKVSTHENVVDMVARVVFPLSYLIFNVVYWLNFFKK